MAGNLTLTQSLAKALPLINPSAVLSYTFNDIIKPGPANVLQSTLPFYELVILTSALILWIVLHIYFWKLVYYQVDDPYATPYGGALPYERRSIDNDPSSLPPLPYRRKRYMS